MSELERLREENRVLRGNVVAAQKEINRLNDYIDDGIEENNKMDSFMKLSEPILMIVLENSTGVIKEQAKKALDISSCFGLI